MCRMAPSTQVKKAYSETILALTIWKPILLTDDDKFSVSPENLQWKQARSVVIDFV